MEDKLLEFAAKALNIDKEEIKTILEDESNGGLQVLIDKDAARVKEVKDMGYKSAERKTNAQWEQSLKSEFGLQSDAKGTELLSDLKETINTKAPAEPTEITEKQLKKHPLYLEMERKAQEVEKTVSEKYEKQLTQLQEAQQQKEMLNGVKGKAKSIFDSLKPILSTDPKKAETQVNELFLRKLENYKYQQDGDSYLLLDPETGERLNNAQGYALKFEDVVKELAANAFDFQEVEQRSSSARNPEQQTTPTVTVPKTREEYAKFLDSDVPIEQKKQVMEAYNAQS